VSAEELRDYLRNQVISYFGAAHLEGNLDWLDAYVDRMMKDEQQLETAHRRLISEKLFLWAETRIQPEEKNISLDEFRKLQHEHEHHEH